MIYGIYFTNNTVWILGECLLYNVVHFLQLEIVLVSIDSILCNYLAIILFAGIAKSNGLEGHVTVLGIV